MTMLLDTQMDTPWIQPIVYDLPKFRFIMPPLLSERLILKHQFISKTDADYLLDVLRIDLPWFQRSDRYGLQPRLTYWCGPYPYSYSGLTHQTQNEWHPLLQELRIRLQAETGKQFNSVLCNLYRDQKDNVDWHSDDEPSLRKWPYIASISLGACRPFQLRKKNAPFSDHVITVQLDHGSLLIMEGSLQEHWQHRLPPIDDKCEARVNLTFRTIYAE